jgi:hypothetical protein
VTDTALVSPRERDCLGQLILRLTVADRQPPGNRANRVAGVEHAPRGVVRVQDAAPLGDDDDTRADMIERRTQDLPLERLQIHD